MKAIVGMVAGIVMLVGVAQAKPAHVEECEGLYTQAQVDAAVSAAVQAALAGEQAPHGYQVCKQRRNGVCRPTRTYLVPVYGPIK